jgi:cobalamin biosynthesis protein CobT
MAALLPHVAGVRQRLIQTLLAETRARWLPDQEEGGLNPRALHRLAAVRHLRQPASPCQESIEPDAAALNRLHPDADALTRRMFRKRVVAKRLKTAVTLLVDLSHSMRGSKLDIARDTALVLCEALSRLNIPVAVWGFSTEHHGQILQETARTTGIPVEQLDKQYRFAPLVHENFKSFGEPFRKISGRFGQMKTYFMTPLGESLLFAARELLGRREERKVLMILTDGKPAVGMGNDTATYRHAKDSIVRIEKAGVEVALVGIIERCVLDLHYRAVVVDALEHLPGAVMRQLQQVLAQSSRVPRRVAA